jgi:hypothetical protein
MPEQALEQRVGAIRHFNRLYTRQIGVLQDGFLQTPYSLAEARVLYELAQRNKLTATDSPPRSASITAISAASCAVSASAA